MDRAATLLARRDGKCAGRVGASEIADQLSNRVGRVVEHEMTGIGHDLQAGAGDLALQALAGAAGGGAELTLARAR